MIQLTRLNEQAFALNTDLIERIEATPDTVLTLIDGTRYIVREPVDDVIARVIDFRARVVERATEDHVGAELHVIPGAMGEPDSDEPSGAEGTDQGNEV